MKIHIAADKTVLGQQAAAAGADAIREAIGAKGHANIIVATGASQFEMIDHLVQQPGIAWDKVTAFHLDEYVGVSLTHPASFRLYLWRRFVSRLPLPLRAFHYLSGEGDAQAESKRVGAILRGQAIDVAFVGIGENAHLAFNDPPADFDTTEPYLVVNLDEDCRKQQLGEGWFKTLEDVPNQAISMSIHQIMLSKVIICSVPDERKSDAVQKSLEGPITPSVPASVMQRHGQVTVYLDPPSAQKLSNQPVA